MLGAFSYNFENKGKYYLHLWSTERQWLIFSFILVIHERILVTPPPPPHSVYVKLTIFMISSV